MVGSEQVVKHTDQINLAGEVLPRVSMEVQKISVPLKFESGKFTLKIKKEQLDSLLNDDEEKLLEEIQQRLRIKKKAKLAKGEFDNECQDYITFLTEHKSQVKLQSEIAIKELLGEGDGHD